LSMSNQESIVDYFNRVQILVNAMKVCKEELIDQQIIDKMLRTLTPRFDHVAVEKSKDLNSMKVEELHNSLEAHKQRINERKNSEKNSRTSSPGSIQF